ncbi:MAG TPA: hypothetical protein VHL34_19595 [Rhizomicrobium sp.]|jgi:hypothetical protein|nr:hypothetical protein [Rhizomicrobium sp.]
MKNVLPGAAFAMALLVSSQAFAGTVISDPVAFIKSVYAAEQSGKAPPDDINTPRLQALYDLNTKEFGSDEVGRIDFDIYMNAQDGTITDVKVKGVPVEKGPNREVVIANFKNEGKPQEIHFYFEKGKGGWKLDDARSTKGETWTLSLILKYGWDGAQ